MAKQVIKAQSGGARCEIVIDWEPLDLLAERAADFKRAAVRTVGVDWAEAASEWMKLNASWQDVTTLARRSLGIVPVYSPTEDRYSLTDGMPYMRFLELNEAGKRAVLGPATRLWGDILLRAVGATRI